MATYDKSIPVLDYSYPRQATATTTGPSTGGSEGTSPHSNRRDLVTQPMGGHQMIPSALARKVAICARVTSRRGQYVGGSVSHPAVIPAAAKALMPASWVWPSVSMNPAGDPAWRIGFGADAQPTPSRGT